MTKPKKIVIWGGEDILSSAIELFLAAKGDWKVISISNTENLDALTLAVETKQPDIVIIYQECQNVPTNLLLQLLQEHPAIKVIQISLENNVMEIYSKQNLLLKQASDLITAIENEP